MRPAWTRWIVHHRVAVLACWAVLTLLGVLGALRLPGLLSTSLAVPGTGSARADAALARHFGERPEGTFAVVFETRHPSGRERHALASRLELAAAAVPTSTAGPLQAAPGILYAEITTRLGLQRAASYTPALRRALTGAGPPALVTGPPALQHDLDPVLAADLRHGEAIAVPVALLLLVAVLGVSAALVVPLLFAACTISTAEAVIFLLAHELPMVSYVPNVVELVGLGLAVDYSLLVVHRFREELAGGRDVEQAVVVTVSTAGRTVLLSGAAVAVGLALVVLVPVPFVRSMGVAGLVVPLVAMAAAVTLQPALLSVLGRRGVARLASRRAVAARRAGDDPAGERGRQLVGWVLRHRVAVLAATTAVLLAAAVPLAWLRLTPGSTSEVPASTSSGRGLVLLQRGVGRGLVTPIEVVVEATSGSTLTPAVSAAVLRLARALGQDPEVFAVAIGTRPPYVDRSGRYRRLVVIGRHGFGAAATQQLVGRLRHRLIPAARFPPAVEVLVGGAPAQGVDFLARVYGAFPWVVLAALALAYGLLAVAVRSLVAPAVSVALTVLSLAASYGLLVLVFRFGLGADLLGRYREPQIEGWIPVFLFATLFSLSMDYQVFLLTRIHEAWTAGRGATGSVAEGLQRTGRVVSAAAAIMVVSFAGLVAGRVPGLQELGTGLALGVLLDATVVRLLLMPSLLALLGERTWWRPSPRAATGTRRHPAARRGRAAGRRTVVAGLARVVRARR